MDTTSHNFTWEIDMLGVASPSALYDVAIVNDSLAYAAGEIYLADSTGQIDPAAYNLMRWNGKGWQMLRVQFLDFCGQPSTQSYPTRAVFAFGPADVWISSGSQVVRWDGTSQSTPACVPVSAIKLWGSAATTVYAVGYSGGIAYYDGKTWQRLESGTTMNLLDVQGSAGGSTMWSCSFDHTKLGTYLLRGNASGAEVVYDGTNLEFSVSSDSISGSLSSIYVPDQRRVLVASNAGVYLCPASTQGSGKRLSFSPDWFPGIPNCIRGNNAYDFTIAGDFGVLAHYNGASWKHFSEFMSNENRFYSVAQRGNLLLSVGVTYAGIQSRALAVIGRR
jgi:hypothetical protein